MKLFFTFMILFATGSGAFSQLYKIGHRQVTYIDSSRNNRPVRTEIYYPADTKGENVAVAADGKKFPVMIFGHGYQLTYDSYLWLKDSLVPRGFYVAIPRTEEVLFPSHTNLAKDLAFLATVFKNENASSTSFLFRRVKNSYAVGGHSMGAGCALLSVQYNPLITTVVPFAAAETDPSAIAASAGIKIPAVLFAGKRDCVTPPATNQIPMYNALASTCKNYVEINNAKHCHWAANSAGCTLGEFTCGGFSTAFGPTVTNTIALLVPWLNATLYGNKKEFIRFNTLLTSLTAITYQQQCTVNAYNTGTDIPVLNPLKALPVPAMEQ